MIDNPVRGRLNAWFFAALDGYMHWKYADIKSRLFGQVPSAVVELGPGSGANFRYLAPGTRLIAIEPNRQMHAVLRRVLRPGGRFACAEHVVAPVGSGIHGLQCLIRRPWKWVFEGCDLCRDTASTLQSAGFAQVDVQPLVLPTIFVPIRHQIAAVCMN